jgi:hypothetical protein
MGCREKLTLLVRSQLQNSCTPLEAAQGLPMRLVYDGWSPPQTSRASMAKASGVGLAAANEADIRVRRGRLVRDSFMFVVGLVGWAVGLLKEMELLDWMIDVDVRGDDDDDEEEDDD